jgi:hypothetical protein
VITTSNFGQEQFMILDMMEHFAEEVMPLFRKAEAAKTISA